MRVYFIEIHNNDLMFSYLVRVEIDTVIIHTKNQSIASNMMTTR